MQLRSSSLIMTHLSKLAVTRTAAALRPTPELYFARQTYRHRRRGRYPARTQAIAEAAEQWSIYNDPPLYERVFGYRDYEEEVDFLQKAFQKHAQVTGQSQMDVFLELGCGPARHSIEAKRRGVTRVVGVDNQEVMLHYAKQLAGQAGADVELLQGSIGNLSKSLNLGAQAHLAFFPFGTFSHALTIDDALTWLRDAADCLMPGGLIVLELEHPGDIFCGVFRANEWTVDGEKGQESLRVVYGIEEDDINCATQVHTRTVAIERKGERGWEELCVCMVEQKIVTVAELELMARLLHLEVVWYYGSLDIEVDSLFHEETCRMILVLRKPSS